MNPIAEQLKQMVEVDVLGPPPIYSSAGVVTPFQGILLQELKWHPRRHGVIAVCDKDGCILICDLTLDGGRMNFVRDVSLKKLNCKKLNCKKINLCMIIF